MFINSFSDENGGITRHPMSAKLADRIAVDLYLRGTAGRQDQVHPPLVARYNATAEEQKTFDAGHASMTQGWSGTLDQLETYLER